jgi:hypothetical protein
MESSQPPQSFPIELVMDLDARTTALSRSFSTYARTAVHRNRRGVGRNGDCVHPEVVDCELFDPRLNGFRSAFPFLWVCPIRIKESWRGKGAVHQLPRDRNCELREREFRILEMERQKVPGEGT